MSNTDIEKLKQEADQKLLEYITLLESTNDSLLSTLKQCVSVLSQFTEAVPDPEAVKNLLHHLDIIIKAGDQLVFKNTLH